MYPIAKDMGPGRLVESIAVEAMLTRDRVIRIRFSADSASPRQHTRFSRRRASEVSHLMRSDARARLVDDNPFEDSPPSESSSQASHACRLYAASAT